MTTWRLDRPYRWPWLRWLFLLWWRLRERDVQDVHTPTTYGAPAYQYGKVGGLDPDLRVMTETTETPYVCCGWCSAAMAVWTARTGITHSMGGTAHPMRNQGGRPHDNGSTASELRKGASRAFGVELDALAVDEVPDVLRAGFAVVVNLEYADLPGWLQVQGGSFGHSCTLYGWKPAEPANLVGFFDPLWPEGVAGAWAPWPDVRDALWGDGEHSGTVTSWATQPAPVPPQPAPAPPVPEPDVITPAELDAAVLAAQLAAIADRDRAWRETTGWTQPHVPARWTTGVDWTYFGRFGPALPDGSWSGPDAAWDAMSWRA